MNNKMRLNLTGSAFAISLIIYYLICYFLDSSGHKPAGDIDQATANIMLGVFVLFSASSAGLILLLKNIMKKKQLNDQQKFKFYMLIFGLCDAPGVMGILLYFLTANMTYFYILAGMSLILLAVFWPRD